MPLILRQQSGSCLPFGLSGLVGASAAPAAGKPVASRFLAASTIVVALLALSALWPLISIWPASFAILVTIAMAPAYGLALAIFLAPFQQFAGLGPAEFHMLHGIVWSAVAVRLAVAARPSDIRYVVRSPTAIFFGLFAFLVVFYNALPFHAVYYWLDAGFVGSLAVIVAAIAIPGLLPDYLPRLMVVAIFAAVLLSVGFDFAYLYIPLPELSPLTGRLGLPPDQLRLAGLHTNPLASGKFTLIAACMLAIALIRTDWEQLRFRFIATWILFVVVALALIATESKSTILAFAISLLAVTLAAFRIETITFKSIVPAAKVGLVFVAAIVSWAVILAPAIKHHAATKWLESSSVTQRPDLSALAGVPRNTELLSNLKSEFRIGESFRLQGETENLDNPLKSSVSRESATERSCSLYCTGQRDLLWKAGIQVIHEHWLAGIGFGGWRRALQQKLGYPFDHPHCGFIEVWGEFGLLGAAMYLALAVFLLRRSRSAIRAKVSGFEKWLLVGSSMAMLAFLANELFDTSKFFSMSPHAIWIWSLLALQERFLRQPLTWSVPARFVPFLSDKFKSMPSVAAFVKGDS